jgi:hypothetical protein
MAIRGLFACFEMLRARQACVSNRLPTLACTSAVADLTHLISGSNSFSSNFLNCTTRRGNCVFQVAIELVERIVDAGQLSRNWPMNWA